MTHPFESLYDYQAAVVNKLRDNMRKGIKQQLLAMPTGSGKTVVATAIIHAAQINGKKSLFIVDRKELVGQAATHLRALGLTTGIMQAENTWIPPSWDAIVATIQTLNRRGKPDVDLVFVDEAHFRHEGVTDLMRAWNNVPFIGLSATPHRKGLGKDWPVLVKGPSTRELTDLGRLTPARAFCPGAEHVDRILSGITTTMQTWGMDYNNTQLGKAMSTPELVGDIVQTWTKHAADRPTLVFAVNIAHSKAIAEAFMVEGVTVEHIDAYTDEDKRSDVIKAFKAGRVQVLTSVNVLSIGFDAPNASCAVLARPTKSEALHWQQVGRVIRTSPQTGKTDALILDHAGNVLRYGLPIHYEIPDLDNGERKTGADRTKPERKMVTCSECGAALEPDQRICPACGIDRPVRKPEVIELDGELVEFGSKKTGKKIYTRADQMRWYRMIHGQVLSEGPRDDGKEPLKVVFGRWKLRFPHDKAPWSWRDLPPLMPDAEVLGWWRGQQIRRRIARRKGGRI